MKLLLEVDRFCVNGGVGRTMIRANIDVQKRDFGRGIVTSELEKIAVIETFKEVGERELRSWGQRKKISSKNTGRGWTSQERNEGSSVQERR